MPHTLASSVICHLQPGMLIHHIFLITPHKPLQGCHKTLSNVRSKDDFEPIIHNTAFAIMLTKQQKLDLPPTLTSEYY